VIDTFDPEHDNQIAQLLKLAGRRPMPDSKRMQQACDAARTEWRRTVVGRRRRRISLFSVAAGAAAAVAAAALLWFGGPRPIIEAPTVASAQRLTGVIHVVDASDRVVDRSLTTGGRLRAGDRVELSAASRAAFALDNPTSVRLAGDTRVRFAAADRLVLERGTLYLDARPAAATSVAVVIETPFGRVRHVGTQFELRLDAASLDVRVREGQAVVDRDGGHFTTTVGEALRIRGDGTTERRSIETSGQDWDWITTIAPPFTLEGATVPALLEWVSREQGWQWAFEDAAARRLAERAVLHGSIEGLTPEEALAAALPVAGLTARRQGARLIVAAR
jgi:transmembrane sensor